MKKFIVRAQVMVPVYGHVTIEAASAEEAAKLALGGVQGMAADTEWESRLWIDGDWTYTAWEDAEQLQVTDTEEDYDASELQIRLKESQNENHNGRHLRVGSASSDLVDHMPRRVCGIQKRGRFQTPALQRLDRLLEAFRSTAVRWALLLRSWRAS